MFFLLTDYVIVQGINAVYKRFISLVQKTFEAGPKNRPTFSQATHNREHCWCPINLKYLQKVFKNLP